MYKFPSIETMLQIYLTMPCTNCNSERSLRRVKTQLKTCLSQYRFDNLTLLTLEHEITKQLSYDDTLIFFRKTIGKNNVFNCNMLLYKIKYTFLNKIINNFI
jgi:hypothetical protein